MELPKDMILPDDILHLIREFSQPLTRPDWRTIHKFTQHNLIHDLLPIPHVELTATCFVLQYKNILLVFDHDIFCVFRFDDYLIHG